MSGSQLYTLRPGEGRKAAFDAVIILGFISDAANIALVLFAAYDRFIAPTKRGASDNSGIYISVPKPDGSSIEICIGKDVLTQEQFKEGFTLAVELSISSEPDNIHDHIVGEVELSGDWDKH